MLQTSVPCVYTQFLCPPLVFRTRLRSAHGYARRLRDFRMPASSNHPYDAHKNEASYWQINKKHTTKKRTLQAKTSCAFLPVLTAHKQRVAGIVRLVDSKQTHNRGCGCRSHSAATSLTPAPSLRRRRRHRQQKPTSRTSHTTMATAGSFARNFNFVNNSF